MLFCRVGVYRGGVFRFLLRFGAAFPQQPPRLLFVPPLPFHPCVESTTGVVSFAGDARLANWHAPTTFVVHGA